MLTTITNIIKSVLSVLYQSFWFSVLVAVLAVFFFICVKEFGLRGAFERAVGAIKGSWRFRRLLVLSFFTAMILMETLFNRFTWQDPLRDVMGDWVIYRNKDGSLNTRCLENILLMLPFIVALFAAVGDKLMKKITFISVVWRSVAISFCFSLFIELMQLFARLGTFQLADLAYNTLGGLIGGMIYIVGYKVSSAIKNRKKSRVD